MTLTIGIIAKDGIVIASDSKMSSSISSIDNIEKIFELNEKVAVGIAGDGTLASHIFDLIKKEKKLNLDDGIQSIAEQLRKEFADAYDRYYPNIQFRDRAELEILLVGYSSDSPPIPHLYILSYEDNFVPRQSPAGHNSIGVPHISQYILNRTYEKDKITSKQAAKLSVFCIRETSLQAKSVGGRIKVATFSEKSKFTLLPNQDVSKLFKQCKDMHDLHRNRFYPEENEGEVSTGNA